MSALQQALTVIAAASGDALMSAKCSALIRGYDARWRNSGYTAVTVEQVYESPLFNPQTEAESRSFRMAGRIDVIAELFGRTYIIDHKTTSQDITDPNSPYWRQLTIEGQVNHYFLLQWIHGIKPDGAVWDVIRRPTISPKKITKAEKALVLSSQRYFNRPVGYMTLVALQTEDRETLEMYEARLTDDCVHERPEWYFQRRPVPRLDSEVLEYAHELWDHAKEILHTRQRQRDTGRLPPRNSGACLLYGTPCKFLGICSGHDNPDSDRWTKKPHLHPELAGELGDGLDVLTNSRIRTFQTCRRKAYYDYDLAIERHDDEDKEALVFGTLLHEGLRAWWECYLQPEKDGQNVHSNSEGSELSAAGTDHTP